MTRPLCVGSPSRNVAKRKKAVLVLVSMPTQNTTNVYIYKYICIWCRHLISGDWIQLPGDLSRGSRSNIQECQENIDVGRKFLPTIGSPVGC